MALKEDYKDAVFAGLRKYKMLDNGDGTVSPVDMTEYEAAGDKFGAKDVNAITKMVNCTGDAFDPGRDYEVGDYTIYDNTVWKFTTAHPAGMWDESHVEKTRILVEIAEQNKNFEALIENLKWTELSAVTGQNTISIPECNEIILEASYDNKRAVLHVPYNIIGANAKTYYIGNSALDFRVSISKTRAMLYGALLNGSTDVLSSTSLQLVYR